MTGRSRIAVALVILAWALCTWLLLRPEQIASDWHSWRQTDTQSIALNFTRPGSSVLMPRIDWGGDGPGYVETEFQLYTRIVSLFMSAFGTGEWAGQLVSLLAMSAAAIVVFSHLSSRYTELAAFLGFLGFLAVRTSCHMATVVMPDALALLAYVLAWRFFCQYTRTSRPRDIIIYGVAGTLAMLVKPTTAHLGISSFLLLVLSDRTRLRDYRVWLTWLAMVFVFGAYLVCAHKLYTQYGNTFGMLIGEDSKAPRLKYLLLPGPYLKAARWGINWGFGYVALFALVVQTLRKRLSSEAAALVVGNLAIVPIALRYMSDGAGVHYFAPASLLAALVVARLAADLLDWRRYAAYALFALVVGEAYRSMKIRSYDATSIGDDGMIALGKEVERLTKPGDLIIARSPRDAFDQDWAQAANYHDPRLFYLSRTRGWNIGKDQHDVALLADFTRRGARLFVDPLPERPSAMDDWLSKHGELVPPPPGMTGRIWKLNSEARSMLQPPDADGAVAEPWSWPWFSSSRWVHPAATI